MDESASLAMFGDFRQFGSYMMGLSSRLKTMLNNIKPTADPTTRLVTLQELSELLSFSTEDTLAGSFPVESFVRELVKILGGRGTDEEEDDDDGDEGRENDEDAALAAALAMSTGGNYAGDDNLEAQVLACRCLANLIEALPGVAHTVVYHGAIPALCSKLIEISYIDLAEQTLSVSWHRFFRLFAHSQIPLDLGKNFGGIPELHRTRGRTCRASQLSRLFLDCGAEDCFASSIELLP
jgi:E3 ubiquitin-protein ligase TRIP12